MMTTRRLGMGAVTPGVPQLIQSAAARYGLDPNLLASVATTESGMQQNRTSGAGAIGVMQLMPGTAAMYGANPYDVAQNVDAGAHYLSDMLARYNGDVILALAAYNAGPGNVDAYGGVPPFPETQHYVDSVTAGYAPYAGDVASGYFQGPRQSSPGATGNEFASDGTPANGNYLPTFQSPTMATDSPLNGVGLLAIAGLALLALTQA